MPAKKTSKSKSTAAKAKIVKTRVGLTAKNTRVKAHTSSRTKRQQAKRDTRNG